jgi:hypothetical protein
MDLINNPVFICGHPKAGTSLITALFDGHPEILSYPEETMFFRRFLRDIEGKTFDEQLHLAETLLIHIFEWNLENPPEHQRDYPDRDYSNISFEAVREEMYRQLSHDPHSPHAFLNAAIISFGKVSGLLRKETRRWIEKTPYNEYYADQIFNWWTGAQCIHIVRDPRDNFLSYQKKHQNWSAVMFGKNWVKSIRAGLENLKKFGDSRYFLVKFGDLLTKPEETMQTLADFIGIKWDESLLLPTRTGDVWRGNSMFSEKFQGISQKPLFRWKTDLDPFDHAILQTVCGREMSNLGYSLPELDRSGFTRQQRLKILREKLISALH